MSNSIYRFLIFILFLVAANTNIFATEPTTQASNIVFSNVNETQMTISWTNGNGASRVVFLVQANTGSAQITDGTTYTANSAFGNESSEIVTLVPLPPPTGGFRENHTGHFCVYNGTGNNVTVTNIESSLQYVVSVYEYNGNPSTEDYLTDLTVPYNPYCYTSAIFSGAGSGTEDDPFQVTNASQLAEISNYTQLAYKYFKIMNDINLTAYLSEGGDGYNDGAFWSPIGGSTNSYCVIDGNNKTISGLKINRSSTRNCGLFGSSVYSTVYGIWGIIKDLNVIIDDYGINCSYYSGGLVGLSYGIIENCHVSGGPINANGTSTGAVGGLVGYFRGALFNSSSSINVTGKKDQFGGLVGYAAKNEDYIFGNEEYDTYLLRNCYATGNVTTDGTKVGGLVGDSPSPFAKISNSYSIGNVKGLNVVGGFIGYYSSSNVDYSIENCYSTGNVTRNSDASDTKLGGFIGSFYRGTIQKCYSTGSVTYAGVDNPTDKGFCGYLYPNYSPIATNNFWNTTTSGQTSDLAGTATGITTAQMQTTTTFTDAEWDFTNTWTIDASLNSNRGFPYLKNVELALPVELTSFTAAVIEEGIQLSWQTATEVNNYGFSIERAIYNTECTIDNWEEVGFVEGHGNSNSPKSYQFTDNLSLDLDPSLNLEYRLKQIDTDGQFEYYSLTAKVDLNITDVEDSNIPTEFALEQNYPNPFNPSTVISYQLSAVSKVQLKVFDILGREVATLVNKEQVAGYYSVNFNASNLSSGMYIYRITAGDFVQTCKMLLMK